ncbi:MAG: ABC transporter permease [Phycisphaerae bacterium]|nr:ABC transporter permease [Phycisphaerae bacterium]
MQSIALLQDSWRLLRSRKLFWITLAINLLVVVLYGSIGFTENGVSILFGLTSFEAPRFRLGLPLARELYLTIFANFIVTLWLGWIATALAIISTTSIFPDFLSEGAIDMVLAKPISRTRVFLVKYAGSLLFVLMQVTTFCVGAFLCVGWRMGEWNWGLFVAIPLIVLFFSYLYCVNVLLGVLTRSTIAALIGTAIFWLVLWATNSAETIVRQIAYRQDEEAIAAVARRDDLDKRLKELEAAGKTRETSNEFERVRGSLKTARQTADEEAEDASLGMRWLTGIEWATLILPKHAETIGLVDRWVGKDPERSFSELLLGNGPPPRMPEERREQFAMDRRVSERVEASVKSTSSLWIIGSSLAFEVVVLGAAVWLFRRKDF